MSDRDGRGRRHRSARVLLRRCSNALCPDAAYALLLRAALPSSGQPLPSKPATPSRGTEGAVSAALVGWRDGDGPRRHMRARASRVKQTILHVEDATERPPRTRRERPVEAPVLPILLATFAASCALARPADTSTVLMRTPPRVEVFDEVPSESDLYQIAAEPLPRDFFRLAAVERERWYACQLFIVTRERGNCRFGEGWGIVGQHLLWMGSIPRWNLRTPVEEYLAQGDPSTRRRWLVQRGCPHGLVEEADGTLVHTIEREIPVESSPRERSSLTAAEAWRMLGESPPRGAQPLAPSIYASPWREVSFPFSPYRR